MNSPPEPRRFAIAVSFPGEHRRFVKNVVERLAEAFGRERVFYDEWYEAELVGLDGDLKLKRFYRDQSRMIVPFFSEYYRKPWCEIEWHAIRAMLKDRRADDAVVPVRMDGTEIEGWESIDFAIPRKRRTGKEIADLILAAYRYRHPGAVVVDGLEESHEPVTPQRVETKRRMRRGEIDRMLAGVDDLIRQTTVGPSSGLSPGQRLAALQAEYKELVFRAAAGDQEAARLLGDRGQELLRLVEGTPQARIVTDLVREGAQLVRALFPESGSSGSGKADRDH